MRVKDIYGQTPRLKILITTPAVNARNGGIQVLIAWCNHLKNTFGHDVTLFTELKHETRCDWRRLDVPITAEFKGGYYDVVIIGSPHSIWIEDFITTEKCFLFAQMAEHLFHPDDLRWVSKCLKFYRSKFPMFSISTWNIAEFQNMGRTAHTEYISNGVDFNDFPLWYGWVTKDPKVALLESPQSGNPTKDTDMLALRLAGELKAKGFQVLAYGARPLSHFRQNVTAYNNNPKLSTINNLYQSASVMIKATKMDARSCSPLEAMTKGCVTSRAINQGDDDLADGVNSMVCRYDYNELKEQTLELLKNHELRKKLAEKCITYVSQQTWQKALEPVNEIICGY